MMETTKKEHELHQSQKVQFKKKIKQDNEKTLIFIKEKKCMSNSNSYKLYVNIGNLCDWRHTLETYKHMILLVINYC